MSVHSGVRTVQNRLFALILALVLSGLWSATVSALPSVTQTVQPVLAERLSEADYRWIGARIYQNESASNPRYLTHWGKGEEFPSLGIGHFIWFPDNVSPPFEETFPQMVRYVGRSVPPPNWLRQAMTATTFPAAPWNSRSEFQAAQNTPDMKRLREWLLATQAQQARFIVASFEQRWQAAIETLPPSRQHSLNQKLEAMSSFKEGLFSVVDYFNFKGIGANPKEQYHGEEWGLISVLEALPTPVFAAWTPQKKLTAFIDSAKARLKLRTELAPPERNEQRWIKGWFKRLDGYQNDRVQIQGNER